MQKFYAEINKVDDEQRLVWGYASTEALDQQKEIVKREAIVDALDDYMAFGNIREMHQPSAVGVAKSATIDDKGMLLCAKVVDDAAWAKVKEGVYKGFSIGGRALMKVGGVISKMRLMEISLVDRPANPECTISMFKREDAMLVPAYINKGMYNVAELATIIERLGNLRAWVLSEGEWEGGDANDIAQAAALSSSITGLVELLSAMVTEEGAEITAAEEVGDMQKADDEKKAAHAAAIEKGDKSECGPDCGCDAEKVESAPEGGSAVAKLDEGTEFAKALSAVTDKFEKALATQRDEFEERLKALAAEPVPAKGVVNAAAVVTKADDSPESAQETALLAEFEPFQKAMLAGDTQAAAVEQIKLIHKFAPQRLV